MGFAEGKMSTTIHLEFWFYQQRKTTNQRIYTVYVDFNYYNPFTFIYLLGWHSSSFTFSISFSSSIKRRVFELSTALLLHHWKRKVISIFLQLEIQQILDAWTYKQKNMYLLGQSGYLLLKLKNKTQKKRTTDFTLFSQALHISV